MTERITWANERRKLRDLVPWERNPREINKREAERLGDSLVEFGQIQTIAIGPDNEVYDGHQRKFVWGVLPQFGPDYEVDVRVSSRALTERERQKLVVYLHKGTTGEWDWDELANSFEVGDLLEWGFEESELQLDWGDDATPDPGAQVDKAAELQEKWQVERGQIWQVGRHRVMCGDSTSAEDVGRLLDGAEPYLMVTDPPYGVEYDPEWRNEAAAEGKLAYAARRVGRVENDDRCDWSEVYELWPCKVLYAWSPGGAHIIETGTAVLAAGFQIRNQIIWCKPHYPISRGHYTYQHEPCWYAVRKGATAQWVGPTNESTRWEIPLDKNVEGGHSTQKPLECMARPIRNHRGDVGDPFVGTGTTVVGAENNDRTCYAMDISPAYVAVTLERLTGMGLEAVKVEQG